MNKSHQFSIRHAEPGDYEAVRQIYSGPLAIRGTPQLPFPSAEQFRKRLADPQEGQYSLVACADDEVVGSLRLLTFPNFPRRRHVGTIAMAVRDDWQGKGAGTALVEAAVELADNWLNLVRLELEVFIDNDHALRLYKNFGFEVEGTARSFAYREGGFADYM